MERREEASFKGFMCMYVCICLVIIHITRVYTLCSVFLIFDSIFLCRGVCSSARSVNRRMHAISGIADYQNAIVEINGDDYFS